MHQTDDILGVIATLRKEGTLEIIVYHPPSGRVLLAKSTLVEDLSKFLSKGIYYLNLWIYLVAKL